MSNKFINAQYSTNNVDVGVYTIKTDEKVAVRPVVALMIPRMEGNYNKGLFECAVNTLSDAASALRYNKKEYGSNQTEHGIDEDLQRVVKTMTATLQYIVNSTSWRTGEYHVFDRAEIENRLRGLSHG
jgi:hypothetical protein